MTIDNVGDSLTALSDYRELTTSNARTLPPELYVSKELYELEIDAIWSKNWICVAHEAELQNPGDFVGLELIGEPIALIRGHDGVIRALSSVCRHRFMPIVEQGDGGNTAHLRCPYHRWTYSTDGRLEAAAYMERNECFAMDEIALPDFRVEVWHGFVFVNLDDGAAPLAPQMSGLDAHFRRNRLVEDCSDWVLVDRYDKVWDCNWKASTENSLESYHHMGVHRGTIENYAPTRSVEDSIEYGDRYSYYQIPYDMKTESAQRMVEQSGWVPGDMGMGVPMLEISFTPPTTAFTVSPDSFGYYTMWPISHDRTRVYCGVFARPRASGELRPASSEFGSNFLEQVMDEDGTAMPGVQRSLASRKVEAGALSWLEEPILRWYQWLGRQMHDPATD
ncbi:MAG: aromatic ring-hydroxylating dioxygenase subunit alpha [Actinomycetota bacterium]